MSQESLTTSTAKPGDFFAGASLIDFITRWSLGALALQSTTTDQPSRTFTWHHDCTGAQFSHSVCLQTTAGAPRYDKAAVLRMIGHFLLSRMPDDGLAETCESLAETYDYYLARGQKRLECTSPTSRSYYATLGNSYVRPTFRITEQE